MSHDPVNSPSHYTDHPSGAECIDIAEWFTFNLGNAIKYIWRSGKKGDRIEDLKKARWYLDREIARLESARMNSSPDNSYADPYVTLWGKIDNA